MSMRYLALALLVMVALSMGQGAWAAERKFEMTKTGNDEVILITYGGVLYLPQTDTDRFLAEKVEPAIKAGNESLSVSDSMGKMAAPQAKMSTAQNAIAHYLKALVEIESERLRRESK